MLACWFFGTIESDALSDAFKLLTIIVAAGGTSFGRNELGKWSSSESIKADRGMKR